MVRGGCYIRLILGFRHIGTLVGAVYPFVADGTNVPDAKNLATNVFPQRHLLTYQRKTSYR